MVVSEHKRSGMGGNQSKTQEKRQRKKELGDEGGKQLPAIFSAQKVKNNQKIQHKVTIKQKYPVEQDHGKVTSKIL